MFTPGDGVAVAVSGGADSVCLLHALLELAPRWQLTLSVLHVNHNLRGEASRGDAEFVRCLAGVARSSVHALRSGPFRRWAGTWSKPARNGRLAFFHRHLAERARYPDRSGPYTVRSGRNRTLSFFARQRRHRTRRDPPGYGPGYRPAADRRSSGRRSWLFWASARSRGARMLLTPRWILPATGYATSCCPNSPGSGTPAIAETLAHTADLSLAEEAYWQAEIDRLAGLSPYPPGRRRVDFRGGAGGPAACGRPPPGPPRDTGGWRRQSGW